MPIYLWSDIFNRNLHVLVRIFLFQQGVECLVHSDEELAGVCRRLI